MDLIPGIIYSFAALFIILDPLLSVPIFAAMTKGQTPAEIHKQAFIAVSVAGGLINLFLIFNKTIFDILGLTLPSFQIAGGILLFLLGIQEALGIEIGHCKDRAKTAAGVVIGTPLLCGPGTITTVMLLSKDYGLLIPFIAITLSLLATWLILYYSELIQRGTWRSCHRYHGQGSRHARCGHCHQDHRFGRDGNGNRSLTGYFFFENRSGYESRFIEKTSTIWCGWYLIFASRRPATPRSLSRFM